MKERLLYLYNKLNLYALQQLQYGTNSSKLNVNSINNNTTYGNNDRDNSVMLQFIGFDNFIIICIISY